MPVVKDRIYIGDTYPVAYECYEPQTNGTQYSRTPKNPVSVTARLWSVQEQAFVRLGVATDDASGFVDQNVAEYTVPSSKTGTAGDYKLFVTITFDDGQVVTEIRQFKIQARQ